MLLSVYKPTNYAHRARVALSTDELKSMYGRKTHRSGDRVDITTNGTGRITLTPNKEGRLALCKANSKERPAMITVAATELGLKSEHLPPAEIQTTASNDGSIAGRMPANMRAGVKTTKRGRNATTRAAKARRAASRLGSATAKPKTQPPSTDIETALGAPRAMISGTLTAIQHLVSTLNAELGEDESLTAEITADGKVRIRGKTEVVME